MWDAIFSQYVLFLAILVRMTGMILLNPFFDRKSVPMIVKIGLALFCAAFLTASLPAAEMPAYSLPGFFLLCVKELLVGLFIGFLMRLFITALIQAGDFIDLQLGVSMARIYDPQSNISMPVSGSLFQLFYIVVFFASNGHLTFLRVAFLSFDMLYPGSFALDGEAWIYAALLFSQIMVLSLKIAMPIMAIEIATELGLGVMMRAVPQINLFSVGLQLKLLVGLIVLALAMAGVFGVFDTITNGMFESVYEGMRRMNG